MTIKLAVLMDPIEGIDPKHDSTFSMLLAAKERGWQLFYFQQKDLFSETGRVKATVQQIEVSTGKEHFTASSPKVKELNEFDIVLMRKDPPFNMEYIYTTYLLEQAEDQGAFVVNNPRSLRDANEKLFTLWFPEDCPKTLVSADKETIKKFWKQHGECILKPLDGMGGRSIFHVKKDNTNINVIIEMLTRLSALHIMVQEYIPAIKEEGDKRIILIDGEPIPYALARYPSDDDIRGNMMAGATVKVLPLSEKELALCKRVGPILKEKGLLFVGLDVIGGYITEMNVTSPTGIQELDRLQNLNIADDFMAALERKLLSED